MLGTKCKLRLQLRTKFLFRSGDRRMLASNTSISALDSCPTRHHYLGPSRTAATQIYVCHANVIRYFLLRALQLDERAWLRLSVAHASIVWISVDHDGYVSCRLVGDAGHLPVEKLTY